MCHRSRCVMANGEATHQNTEKRSQTPTPMSFPTRARYHARETAAAEAAVALDDSKKFRKNARKRGCGCGQRGRALPHPSRCAASVRFISPPSAFSRASRFLHSESCSSKPRHEGSAAQIRCRWCVSETPCAPLGIPWTSLRRPPRRLR